MKEEIKQKWVDALRSGQYEKGKWYLTRRNEGKETFCVLGVLCDLAIKDGVELPVIYGDGNDNEAQWTEFRIYQSMWNEEEGEYDDPNYTDLPNEVLRWAGLDENPIVVYGEDLATLTELNDRVDLPFPVIAQLINDQL